MNKSTWIHLALALSLAGGLGWHLSRTAEKGPSDLLERARARLAQEPADFDRAFHELDLALKLAERSGDDELFQDVLMERASALHRRGVREAALRDYRRLVELDGSLRASLWVNISRLELDAANYDGVLRTTDKLLADFPGHEQAHELRGLAHRARAEELLAEFGQLLEDTLPPRQAQELRELADRIVTRDRFDPLRASDLAELEQLLADHGKRRLQDSRGILELATDAFAAARDEFVRANAQNIFPTAIRSLCDIYRRAGRTTLAVDLGLAALVQPAVSSDPATLQILASALSDQGRPDAAAAVIDRGLPREEQANLAPEFLPEWAGILYASEQWARLLIVAGELSRTPTWMEDAKERTDAGVFYLGAALAKLGQVDEAEQHLRSFARTDSEEPVPGARALAWREIAALERAAGRLGPELQALRQATWLDPSGSADAWERLAEIESERPGEVMVAAESLTRAIEHDPRRADRLEDRWRELGEAGLVERGIDIGLTLERLYAQDLVQPGEFASTFEVFRIAEAHLGHGHAAASLETIERLLEAHPGFVPALDVRAAALEGLGRTDERIETLLSRLEGAPRHAPTRDALRQLEREGELEPPHVFRLMQADLEATGTLGFARQLIDGGRADLALRALDEPGRAELGSEVVLLAAEAELELGRPHLALQRLNEVDSTDPRYASALRLSTDAALALREPKLVNLSLGRLVGSTKLDVHDALATAERLIQSRLYEPAALLLEHLDEHPDALTGLEGDARGQLVLVRALTHLLLAEPEVAADALDRAVAWFDDGSADLGRLLLAIQRGGWTGLGRLVRDLRDSEFEPSPLEDAILAGLEERLDEALSKALALEAASFDESGDRDPRASLVRLAVQTLRSDPLDVPARFGPGAEEQTVQLMRGGRGAQGGRRDPRHVLAVLLVLDQPVWRLWADTLFGQRPIESPGGMWLEYLSAHAERAAGDAERAERKLEGLANTFPGFEPAWDMLDDLLLERLGRIDHPERIDLLARRFEAVDASGTPTPGEEPTYAPEVLAAQSLAQERRGNALAAIDLSRRAIQRHPDFLPVRRIAARQWAEQGQLEAALAQYEEFFLRAPADVARVYVPDLLELWERVLTEGVRSADEEATVLEGLSLILPDDPRIALELAKLDIIGTPQNPRLGVERAWNRLDRFRDRWRTRALEELEPGSTSAWLDLYLEYDPERAEHFVRGELDLLPRDLDLWLSLGRTYEEQGRLLDAIAWYQTIRAMVPETRALRRAAEVLAELGTNHPAVESYLRTIRQLDGTKPPDVDRLEFLRAKSLVQSGFTNVARGIEVLDVLWRERDPVSPYLPEHELAYVYASALARHGDPARRELAVELFAGLVESEDDPLLSSGLEALRRVSNRIPDPPPEP